MTRDQIMALDVRTLSSEPQDLRDECRQLVEERNGLLEAIRYFLSGPVSGAKKKDRWVEHLRQAEEKAQTEWKKPTLEPLAPAR